MLIGDMKGSKYLKQGDIDGPALVTITNVVKKNVAPEGKAEDFKFVMSFAELPKPLVLNTTNISRCNAAFGSTDKTPVTEWYGKKIVMYVDPNVEMGGEIVGGIRLRAPKAQAPKEEDIPF